MGIHPPITTRTLRRTGPRALLRQGADSERIVHHLRHRRGTATYTAYVDKLIVADATEAMYGASGGVEEMHDSHPQRPVCQTIVLPASEVAKVMDETEVKEAVASNAELRRELCEAEGVTSSRQLSAPALARLHRSWQATSSIINRYKNHAPRCKHGSILSGGIDGNKRGWKVD